MKDKIHSLKVSLHGSLAATGVGHMTPNAVMLGLMGEDPETVEVGRLGVVLDEVRAVGQIDLGLVQGNHKRVKFDLDKDLVGKCMSAHTDMAPEPAPIAPQRDGIHRV